MLKSDLLFSETLLLVVLPGVPDSLGRFACGGVAGSLLVTGSSLVLD
jgi:hypothetical protein